MPKTEEQNKEIRENKKALILETALELFADEGYSTTSISKIAKQARISKGLMYNYFDSKEELIKIIIMDGFDEISKIFDKGDADIITDDILIKIINTNFDAIKTNLKFWKLYYTIFTQPTVMKLFETKFMEFMSVYINELAKYFASKGADNPMTDAMLFGSIIDGVCFNYVMMPEHYPIDEVKDKIIEMYIKGARN